MAEIIKYYNELILFSIRGVMAVSFLPLIFGLVQWRKLNKTIKIFWLFLLASLILSLGEQAFFWSVGKYTDFWRPILRACNITDTNFIRYPYQFINFSLLGWFLYRMLLPHPIAVWVKWLSIILLVSVTINFFFVQGHNMAGGFNSTASALYCCSLPLISMWFLYNREDKVPLVHNPYFWINLGLIIPSLIGLFLYFAGDNMYNENFVLYAKLTILKNGIEMIAQLLTTIGFYFARNVKYLKTLNL